MAVLCATCSARRRGLAAVPPTPPAPLSLCISSEETPTRLWQPGCLEPRCGCHVSSLADRAAHDIPTSHYTAYNFVPKNLWQQFQRVANVYFLFIGLLQLIPGLSPTHFSTTIGPLLFVLGINAVKAGNRQNYLGCRFGAVTCL